MQSKSKHQRTNMTLFFLHFGYGFGCGVLLFGVFWGEWGRGQSGIDGQRKGKKDLNCDKSISAK